MKNSTWISFAAVAVVAGGLAAGCGGAQSPSYSGGGGAAYASPGTAAPSSSGGYATESSTSVASTSSGSDSAAYRAPSQPVVVTQAPPSPSTPSVSGGGSVAYGQAEIAPPPPPQQTEPHPTTRPGLATEFGETRYNPLGYQPFVRASSAPFATTTVRYNDANGAMAQAAYRQATTPPVAYIGMYGPGVRVSIRDENGVPLRGQIAGDSLYVIGQHSQRYSIVLENQLPLRFEVVASVDGLDVMNGRPAALTNRGYILPAYGTLTIDGFRQDHQHVAAFRFGTVADSYAAQTGSARNVGVIGVALFTEVGAVIPAMPQGEIEMRESANPFPGSFSQPPPRRNYY